MAAANAFRQALTEKNSPVSRPIEIRTKGQARGRLSITVDRQIFVVEKPYKILEKVIPEGKWSAERPQNRMMNFDKIIRQSHEHSIRLRIAE